jgi:hypothetical protein
VYVDGNEFFKVDVTFQDLEAPATACAGDGGFQFARSLPVATIGSEKKRMYLHI